MTSMTLIEWKAVRDALRSRLAELDRITPTCMHCEHFLNAPRCGKFEAVPPQEFRETPEACQHWQYDGVPF